MGHLESCNDNENHCRCHNSGESIDVNFLLYDWYYQSLPVFLRTFNFLF